MLPPNNEAPDAAAPAEEEVVENAEAPADGNLRRGGRLDPDRRRRERDDSDDDDSSVGGEPPARRGRGPSDVRETMRDLANLEDEAQLFTGNIGDRRSRTLPVCYNEDEEYEEYEEDE